MNLHDIGKKNDFQLFTAELIANATHQLELNVIRAETEYLRSILAQGNQVMYAGRPRPVEYVRFDDWYRDAKP